MSWNQIEHDFLSTMAAFDAGLPRDPSEFRQTEGRTSKALTAAVQNGKGDWFNDLLAVLLARCSGIERLFVRRGVHGLMVANYNLDGVYPNDPTREIEFLLEAKMMGTPRHANSLGEKAAGRAGSADLGKRVPELAFKAIDLKGEAARRLAIIRQQAGSGGAGGGDLPTWLHSNRPKIFFFMGIRVVGDTDLKATTQWAAAAAQAVDAVGLYCYEPDPLVAGKYRRRDGVPTEYGLDRVLFRACQELQMLRTAPPPPIPTALPPSPAARAVDEQGTA